MENLTTQESLKIIQTVIDQRKQKYEENGFFLLFWGVLIVISGVTQYIMIRMGKGNISGYVWLFTMVPGFLITFIINFNKNRKRAINRNPVDMLGLVWLIAGILAMLTGFIFGPKFGIGSTTVIFLPFCMAAMASALSLKNYLWICLAIVGTFVAYGSIFVEWHYHSLIVATIALLLFVIPGIQLYVAHKRRDHV